MENQKGPRYLSFWRGKFLVSLVRMVSRVGDIVFDRRSMMGWGPTGTVVLRGTYGDEPVAVKRFISRHLKLDAGDFQTYRSDYHVNILPLLDVTTFSGFT